MKLFILLFFVFFNVHASLMAQTNFERAQAKLNEYWSSQNFPKALEFALKTVDFAKTESDSLHLVALDQLIIVGQYPNAYDIAEKSTEKALSILSKTKGQDSRNYISKLLNLGELQQKMGAYKKAEVNTLKAMTLAENALGKRDNLYAVAIGSLASVYNFMEEYKKAELFALQSIDFFKKNNQTSDANYAGALINLSKIYANLENFEQSEKYALEGIAIKKKVLGSLDPGYATALNDLGIMYSNKQYYKKSLDVYKEVLYIDEKTIGKEHPYYAMSLNNIGGIYQRMGNLDEAERYYSQALAIKKRTIGIHHPSSFYSLLDLGAIASDKKQYEKAFSFFFQGIAANCYPSIEANQVDSLMTNLAQDYNFRNPALAIQTLFNLAETYEKVHETSGDINALQKNYEALLTLNAYIQKRVLELSNKTDQLNLLNYATNSFSQSIIAANKLYQATHDKQYWEATIGFAEQNKSILLTNTLYSEKALSFGELPDSLVQKERSIKEKVLQLQTQIIKASDQKDSATASNFQNELLKTLIEQGKFTAFLRQKYPAYSNLAQNHRPITVQEIQNNLLDENTVLLEYFIRQQHSYIILISKTATKLVHIPFKETELDYSVNQLRKTLSDYTFIQADKKNAFREFSQEAYSLYQKLIHPIASEIKGKKNLLIIPDQQLGHIPFEVLLSDSIPRKEEDYHQLPYLLKDFCISYSYSAALLLENKLNHQASNNGQVLGFAAHYPSMINKDLSHLTKNQENIRLALNELPAAQVELKALEAMLPGLYYYKNEATERQFKATAKDYSILHLAMHGILNEKQPLLSSLAFTEIKDSLHDNFLEAHEISSLRLNADLVVLSACETGYGKFEQGEGVLSLARSFMYAGVPSLVVSLWQVNDHSTEILMKHFYRNLAEGLPKDEALRQAKLNYLNKAQGLTAHPAFWSPFIQIGNPNPIKIARSSKLWLFLGAFCFFLVIIIGFYKFKKS